MLDSSMMFDLVVFLWICHVCVIICDMMQFMLSSYTLKEKLYIGFRIMPHRGQGRGQRGRRWSPIRGRGRGGGEDRTPREGSVTRIDVVVPPQVVPPQAAHL